MICAALRTVLTRSTYTVSTLAFKKSQPGNFEFMCFLNLGRFTLPFHFDVPGTFDPPKAENGDSQEGDGPNAD